MSLILPSSNPNLFSNYVPSTNAHIDILSTDPKPSSTTTPTVKLFIKTRPLPPPTQLLSTLTDSIPLLLQGQSPKTTYHHLSATCRDLVLPPHTLGPSIYSAIKTQLTASVTELEQSWRRSILSRQGDWLSRFTSDWQTWRSRVMTVSAIFTYLDRVYTVPHGIPSIMDLAIGIFRQNAWENQLLYAKTRDDFLAWVSEERQSESESGSGSTRTVIQALVSLSRTLDVYDSLYKPYVDLTEEHYASVVSTRLKESHYVDWVIHEHDREKSRASFIGSGDQKPVKQFLDIAGRDVANQFVPQALSSAMDDKDMQALGQLYTVCTLSGIFPLMSEALQIYLETRLRTLISDPSNDPTMIETTLTLKRFTDTSIRRLADDSNNRKDLEEAVRTGFKLGMGSRQNAPAEWIAKHLDSTMRRGQGSGTEAEFNTLLDEIIALIGFTKDKDVFKAFYSTGLAKRLLLNKSASDDMERNMILKLQKEMGEEFTSGDIMMKDLQLSETLVKTYQSARAKNPESFKDPGNLTANVLTESAWPSYPLLKDGWDFKLTPDLQQSIDAFTSWYSTQHKNRKLSWRHQLATVTLSGRFGGTKYEIGVSLFQAVCLLQFNDEDSLSFKDMKERTGIESSELVRTLQSLSMGRKGTRVLLKRPAGKNIDPTDMFVFNKAFTSERIKFKINQIQQDLSAEESRKTNEQVAIDRVSVLEATIVRIMKARKKMTLQLLIDGVVTAVNKHFPPDVKEIKKRMESLIEREFLMRDEDDRNLLHYLA